jgi:membrane-bound metal-dependent hydrolase YbcI (DUF457 family)
MMGTSHALSGAAVWLAGCAAATSLGAHPAAAPIAAGVAATSLGALLPDLDHPHSLASRAAGPVTWAVSALTRTVSRRVYRATCTDRDDRSGDAGTHRALTHTWPFALWVAVSTGAVLAAAGELWWPLLLRWWWLGLVLGLGCLVHVLGDALTFAGVPVLWPFVSRRRRWRRVRSPLPFRTGGRVEQFVAVPLFAVLGFGGLWVLMDHLTAVGR